LQKAHCFDAANTILSFSQNCFSEWVHSERWSIGVAPNTQPSRHANIAPCRGSVFRIIGSFCSLWTSGWIKLGQKCCFGAKFCSHSPKVPLMLQWRMN